MTKCYRTLQKLAVWVRQIWSDQYQTLQKLFSKLTSPVKKVGLKLKRKEELMHFTKHALISLREVHAVASVENTCSFLQLQIFPNICLAATTPRICLFVSLTRCTATLFGKVLSSQSLGREPYRHSKHLQSQKISLIGLIMCRNEDCV